MANHKSSVKRIRQTATRRLHNRYYAKTMRNAVRKLRATTDKAVAVELLPKVQKMLDKLAKTNIIHKNKAANIKSSLMIHVQQNWLKLPTSSNRISKATPFREWLFFVFYLLKISDTLRFWGIYLAHKKVISAHRTKISSHKIRIYPKSVIR